MTSTNGTSLNDTIIWNLPGGDYDGGAGVDTIDFRNIPSNDFYYDGYGVVAGLNSTDGRYSTGINGFRGALTGFERADGSPHDDGLTGNHGANVLAGRDGDDTLTGLGGADRLYGGAGNDRLYGEDGAFSRLGGADELFGGGGDDWLEGNLGDDRLVGNSGDDYLAGGEGDDVMIGGPGRDRYYVEDHDTILTFRNIETIGALHREAWPVDLDNNGDGWINRWDDAACVAKEDGHWVLTVDLGSDDSVSFVGRTGVDADVFV